MPKIKLKTLANNQDSNYLDVVYQLIDLKYCDSIDELFVLDEYIPILNRNPIKSKTRELAQFLASDTNAKFILLDFHEGSNTSESFMVENRLAEFCEAKKLHLVTSGDLSTNWSFVNIDEFIRFTGSKLNQMIATNTFEKIYNVALKPYKFLFLNKNGRDHRSKLIHLLNDRGLLNQALWSNLAEQITVPDSYADFFNGKKSSTLINQTNYNIDWHDGILNSPFYIDTYFSVITETNYDKSFRYFTEKIYKQLLVGQPFIAVGCYKFYGFLHDQGYKTFGHLIDETFDDIEDNNQRLEHIANSIQELCSQDLNAFLLKSKEICQYNQQVYLEKLGRHNFTVYNKLGNFLEGIHDNT